MKVCAACHTDLPKDSYSKKQWKLDEYQRRCKVCITDNREVQPVTNEIIKSLDSMYLENIKKKISDEELFKQPPPLDDCPICFLTLPTFHSGSTYMICCGKFVCSGCVYAPVYDDQGKKVADKKCPFCRTPHPTSDKEITERLITRMDNNDPIAIFNRGCDYRDGICGYQQDHIKALELYHRAAELGCAKAYCSIGYAYDAGEGVEVDKKKSKYYLELSAMMGSEAARHDLGMKEEDEGDMERALKHWMIAIGDGDAGSLKQIKRLYSNGLATKEDYTKALQAYQEYLGEIKSVQRDKAAAADEDNRYY